MIEPRGSRRLSSQSLLDLRVSKMLRLGSAGTMDLRFDVLNLLNDSAEESLQSDVLFNRVRPAQHHDVRPAERVHGPAARHAQRAAEPGTMN